MPIVLGKGINARSVWAPEKSVEVVKKDVSNDLQSGQS
jgi:hypothetical protein